MASSDLIFSEYVEGSSSNKALEIYNGTGAAIDLAAAGYAIDIYFNGNTTATRFALTGTVAAGDVYVFAHASADPAILAEADQTTGSGLFNGDDAIVLVRGETVVDSIGQVGVDPGSEWGGDPLGTQDMTLRRDAGVLEGDTDPADAFDPTQGWTASATDDFSGLGSHDTTVPLMINEIQVSTSGSDWEFVELHGAAGASLDGWSLIGLDGDGADAGTIDLAIDLTGQSIGADGLFLAASPTAQSTYSVTADLGIADNSFENGTSSYFLVHGFTGAVGDDLDAQDDGALDSTPWDTLADSVALTDGGAGDATYAAAVIGPDGSFLPSGGFRDGDGGAWSETLLDFSTPDGTPGAPNPATEDPGDPDDPDTPAPTEPTLISAVQGAGAASPLEGQQVMLRAVVTGDFQNGDADDSRNLGGFYLQEEDADADGDARTSEGIFVYDGAFGTDVQVGDVVSVVGTVSEYFGLTELTALSSVTVESSGNALPTAAAIDLSTVGTMVDAGGDVVPDLEFAEGMLVSFTESLTITEMFNLDRFNEIRLVQGDRPMQYTQTHAPDAAGYAAYLEEVGQHSITYDDGLSVQNAPITNLDGFDPFTTATAPSMGDTIGTLTGVLDYQWGGESSSPTTWRVRATSDGENVFEDTNPADTSPQEVGGDLRIASLNVLNFFTTLDDGSLTANGQEPRGANTPEEYQRQLDKLVTTLVEMDADVVGLVEIENDPNSTPLATLVAALNAELGVGTYDYVNTGTLGGDAITGAFIYRTSAVETRGGFATLETEAFLDPLGTGSDLNRPALAQSFRDLETGKSFTAVVNHLKSKGSLSGDAADADQGDGAGNNNATRLAAALALADWLESAPTGEKSGRTIMLGDYNSYAMEDPVQALVDAGYVDLAREFIGEEAWSYVFDGYTGTLDYAFANERWASLVAGVTEWHVNSDEADALDYNTDYGRDPDIFDAASALRNSDHDPVIVGINLVADVRIAAPAEGGGYDRVDGFARFDRALAAAQDGWRVNVDDGAAIGDFGTANVTAEALIVRADAPVSGTLVLGAGVVEIRLRGESGIDVLGSEGANLVVGSHGDNVLEGGAGDDRLMGRDGADLLAGGAGFDILRGGDGADIFRLDLGAEIDVAADFDAGEGDRIDLTAFGYAGFEALQEDMAERHGNVVIATDSGEVLRLRDTALSDLHAEDFLFAIA
ncbi:ExeM/NucH family extracellular endonuclease [Paroceanicella profunda]|uniref:ExeM/NucH family extracellular endonuclease n=1 Tax=Paroceanicella profunda TaxID=2579971 RepID=A0A5B8FVW3_9RHOB|nr:ExeM/NucH family extracellular endonuclease [Paroceanicella profunda]QDL90492.1 ExeM/NucH family extracellular endonuclease [Paroceanicella profunda]